MILQRHLAASFLFLALSGCSVLPAHAPSLGEHDFGPPPTEAPLPATLALVEVSAPAWLDSGEIHYRMADDPTRLRAYATQRWIAPPSRLLAQRLRERLAVTGTRPYALRVRLMRFEQDFAADGSTRAVIRLQARITAADGAIVASRDFDASTPAAPDVGGAVTGLSALARQTATAVLNWAASVTTGGGR